jgi:hypothetical protein
MNIEIFSPYYEWSAEPLSVEALHYKPEGRGFHYGRTMALESTQPLTEMSTRIISLGLKMRKFDNPTAFMCRFSSNLGTSSSQNPQGLSRSVMEPLYLYIVTDDLSLLRIIICSYP